MPVCPDIQQVSPADLKVPRRSNVQLISQALAVDDMMNRQQWMTVAAAKAVHSQNPFTNHIFQTLPAHPYLEKSRTAPLVRCYCSAHKLVARSSGAARVDRAGWR